MDLEYPTPPPTVTDLESDFDTVSISEDESIELDGPAVYRRRSYEPIEEGADLRRSNAIRLPRMRTVAEIIDLTVSDSDSNQ